MIVDRYEDSRNCIKYKTFVELSNGVIGKLITFNDKELHYMITENGEVYNTNTEHKLSPSRWKDGRNLDKNSYLTVNLQIGNSMHITETVHSLVARGFIPNTYGKPIVNHKDGDKTNPSMRNLEWSTYAENLEHARRIGLNAGSLPIRPESCNLTTHTYDDVIKVAKLLEQGFSPKKISSEYGYGYDFVRRILNRQTWKRETRDFKFPIPQQRKHSNIFTTVEINQIIKMLASGMSVRDVLHAMNLEYNEINRGRIKHIKCNVENGKYTMPLPKKLS